MCQPLCVGLLNGCLIGVVLATAVSATAIAPDPLGAAGSLNDLSSTLPSVRMALAAMRDRPDGEPDGTSPVGLLTVAQVAQATKLDDWSFAQSTATRSDFRTADFLAGTPAFTNRPTRVAYLAEQPGLPDELPFEQEAADDTVILQQSIEQPDMDSLESP